MGDRIVSGKPNMWVRDTNHDSYSVGFKIEKSLFSRRSPYQQIDVLKTVDHGNLLLNDGIFMLSERDEFIYHEMIAHVPLFVHPAARKVLVIGGGDGGTVREVLKHACVERVVMVEIDEVVVQASREHFPSVSCALDDPRTSLIFDDGVKFVSETSERFDIVIVDSTDPVGPGEVLFKRSFYQKVGRVLTDQGLLITQAESPLYDADIQMQLFANQRPFFKKLHMYLYPTLTYPGALYGFGFASQCLCPLADFNSERAAAAAIPTRYYNAGIHRSAFMLPSFIRDRFEGLLDSLRWP
jgi:spermidine synthase